MGIYHISMAKHDRACAGVDQLKKILTKDGFVSCKSKIVAASLGTEVNINTRYYASPAKPGVFIAIAETAFHLQVEAMLLRGDAKSFVMKYFNRAQKALE